MAFYYGVSQKDVSSIFGTISLISSLCLLVPQLVMNYRSKTANALSKLFLLVWLLGDLTSLAGGMITSIAPSAIALSAYLCVADSILILQCWYYTSFKKRNRPAESFLPAAHEDAIANSCETDNLIRDDDEVTSPTGRSTELSAVHSPKARTWIFNTGFISCVYIVGFLAWLVSRSSDSESDLPHSNDGNADTWTSRLGLTLGYIGAGCYLCAPIPQIIKNARNRSTKGLASLFFLLSLTNNFTYGLSVLTYSQEQSYLIKSIPWLLGSLGAMVEDFTIFMQFLWYSTA